MSIRHLAWEIISYIAHDLDVDDLFNLSLSCRQLQRLIYDNNICKTVLQSVAPYAPETRSAHRNRDYARALRILCKRRNAISSASPYLAAVVTETEAFLYRDGVLCYVDNGILKIRDLGNSATTEDVVNIKELLHTDRSLPRIPKDKQDYEFRILHYADQWVSCWYAHRDSSPGWLVIFNPSQGRVFSHVLASSRKIFVRNDDKYLYYGTHCDIAEDGSRRWALRGCNLQNGKWNGYLTRLPEMIGSDIGQNICFEIIDGYFYGLANQALFEKEEILWTSYYTCIRFPVDQLKPKNAQIGTTKELWRKFHSEGPIDNRWNFISLAKNERTGTLTIAEGRREWRAGGSPSRTYYTSELVFSDNEDSRLFPSEHLSASDAAGPSSCNNSTPAFLAENLHNPEDGGDEEAPTSRSPHTVHPGDNSATIPLLTLNNSLLRCYHSSCQTYLDIVDHPLPGDLDQRQQIRLRVGSRRLRSPLELGQPAASLAAEHPLYPNQQIKALYQSTKLQFWPPSEWGSEGQNSLDLYDILNSRRHSENFTGICDERSICYTTGGVTTKSIVFISFDPSIRLQGTRPWSRAQTIPKQSFAAAKKRTITAKASPETPMSIGGSGELEKPKWSAQVMHAGIHKGFHFAF